MLGIACGALHAAGHSLYEMQTNTLTLHQVNLAHANIRPLCMKLKGNLKVNQVSDGPFDRSCMTFQKDHQRLGMNIPIWEPIHSYTIGSHFPISHSLTGLSPALSEQYLYIVSLPCPITHYLAIRGASSHLCGGLHAAPRTAHSPPEL